ncbi:MAG: DUF2330 domain-containing protein [Candidatus Hydrogenedentes bacterium]|nr:DUF2330 domain-containing protein [Candidatus Hydrogenedentota bacterium]
MKIRSWCALAIGLLASLSSARSWADGGFIGKRDLYEPEQKAAIFFADGVEDLIIQAKYDGAEGDFAWLVPLPSKPEVSLADDAIFGELRDYTFARSTWLDEELFSGYRSGGFGGPGDSSDSDGVNVLERKRVGVFDVAVLEANTAEDLVRWCEGHGYKVKGKVREVLGSYVDRGWIFTVMRVDPAVQGKESAPAQEAGTIQAMRFTFSTEEAIYPLRISSINRGTTDVLVYVIADDTMIHPSLVQRHPASLYPFERLRALTGSKGHAEWRAQFDAHFDGARFTYRNVAPAELERTRAAFARWGNRTLYLTALQQSFEPEEMEEDVIFKAPERWGLDEQVKFIATGLESSHGNADSLYLRMPEAITAKLSSDLASSELNSITSWLNVMLRMALQVDGAQGTEVLISAVRQAKAAGREAVKEHLRAVWFEEGTVNPVVDQVLEEPRCEWAHKQYVTATEQTRGCHFRIDALPGAGQFADDAVLAELFRTGDPDLEVAKMLAALNTEEGTKLLFEAARGSLDQDGGQARNGRQEMALMALRHTSGPTLAGLYREIFAQHRDALNERELSSCLVGLWTLNDPRTDTLVRQMEGHCLEYQMPSAASLARNLLVNRLRTRPPVVNKGMTLADLEREMGGMGIIENRLSAGAEEVVQYGWASGTATVKGDVVVKWKPTRS